VRVICGRAGGGWQLRGMRESCTDPVPVVPGFVAVLMDAKEFFVDLIAKFGREAEEM